MIKEGFLTHGSKEASVFTLQFTHPTFYAFLIAVLTTLLSYQAAAIVVDLVLGFKRADECQATDVAVLHLSEQSSPLAVLSNVFEQSFFSRMRYCGLLSQDGKVDRRASEHFEGNLPRRMPRTVLSKLIILLISAALINVFSIVLAIEVDRTVSFRDAKFGGVALGVIGNKSEFSKKIISNDCSQYSSNFGVGEYDYPEFFTCGINIVAGAIAKPTDLEVAIRTEGSGAIVIELNTDTSRSYGTVMANMRHNGKTYRIGQQVAEQEARYLLNIGVNFLQHECGKPQQLSVHQIDQVNVNKTGKDMVVSKEVSCKFLDVYKMVEFQNNIMKHIQLIDSRSLKASLISKSKTDGFNFEGVEDSPMLTRKRPLVDLVTFIAILCTIIVARLLLKIYSRNDVHLALELLVRRGLDANPTFSLLQNASTVTYSSSFYHPKYYDDAEFASRDSSDTFN